MRILSIMISVLVAALTIMLFVFLIICQYEYHWDQTPISMRVLSINPGDLMDLNVWTRAAGFSIKTIALTMPTFTCLCAYNK